LATRKFPSRDKLSVLAAQWARFDTSWRRSNCMGGQSGRM